MQDIVPQLLEAIKKDFELGMSKDPVINHFKTRVNDGLAKLADTHDYATRVGEHCSLALQKYLVKSVLPNGQLYYNIADRTVRPMLESNYEMVNSAAIDIQTRIDRTQHIGLKPKKGENPVKRIHGLINKICEEEDFDLAVTWLGEPIINTAESFFDDFVKTNAEFRSNSGMTATITREVSPKCCDWCAELAGTYEYSQAPEDIYRRHENCRCTVTFQSSKGYQNVWSKRTW